MKTSLHLNNTAANTNHITALKRARTTRSVAKLTPIKMVLITALAINPLTIQASYAYQLPKTKEQTEVQSSENGFELSAKNKEEIGFGSGMVLGAIFGGPVGAFITGVAGTLMAKTINDEAEIEQLQTSLDQQEKDYQVAIKQFDKKRRQTDLAHQMEIASIEKNTDKKIQRASQMQAENLLMSLQFNTGSSELQRHYQGQIVALSEMLHQAPNLSIDLSGYTDLLGSKKLNKTLSIARVNSVKKALIEQGVEAERIQLFAFGEQAPVVANHKKESSFYDRRVVIKLRYEDNTVLDQVAKN